MDTPEPCNQLHAASLLSAVWRCDSLQCCRTDCRVHADGGPLYAHRGTRFNGFFGVADADVRLAGASCIDEWTMAACNLAMGATLMLGGSGSWSLDNVLLRNKPQRADSGWFAWASGSKALPLSDTGFRKPALAVLAFVVVFNVGTHSYYRGSVLTPIHSGPISPTAHHLTLVRAAVLADGSVRFHVALNAGTPEAPVHIVAAALLDARGTPVVQWHAETLSKMSKTAFNNDYVYNKFGPGPFGVRALMGAASTVMLPAPAVHTGAVASARTLQLTDVDGRVFSTSL